MKSIVTAIALLSLGSFTFANIQVFWTANGAIVDDDTRTGNPFPDGLPAGSLFQLIWSPDSTAGALDITDPTSPTGGDIVLNTYSSTGPSTPPEIFGDKPNINTTYGLAGDPGGALPNEGEGGFIYTRVFNSANPTIGNFYAQTTPRGPTGDATPPDGSTPSPFDGDITLSGDPEVDQADGTNLLIVDRPIVVPEPGTLLMFALGSLLLIGFRRRR